MIKIGLPNFRYIHSKRAWYSISFRHMFFLSLLVTMLVLANSLREKN